MGYSRLRTNANQPRVVVVEKTTVGNRLLLSVLIVLSLAVLALMAAVGYLIFREKRDDVSAVATSSAPVDSGQYADVAKYVVSIRTPDSRGTGFEVKIGNSVYLYTCLHCIRNFSSIEAVDYNGKTLQLGDLEICSGRDLVRFELGDRKEGLTLASEADVKAGINVIAYGDTQGVGVTTENKGKILAFSNDKVEVDCPVLFGNSGGPILTEELKVIAAVSFGKVEHNDLTKDTRYDKSRRFGVRINSNAWIFSDYEDYRSALIFMENVERFIAEVRHIEEVFNRQRGEQHSRPVANATAYAYNMHLSGWIDTMYGFYNEAVKCYAEAEEIRQQKSNEAGWVGYLNRQKEKKDRGRNFERRACSELPISYYNKIVSDLRKIDFRDEQMMAKRNELVFKISTVEIPFARRMGNVVDEDIADDNEMYKKNLKVWDDERNK